LSNSNGTTNFTTGAIRLDLLTASSVIDADILDVRRQVQVPAVAELLDSSFEQLMDGQLKTRMALDTAGGDKFGTEIFQLDTVGVASGGTQIPNASLDDAARGLISSQATLVPITYSVQATGNVPSPQTFTDTNGIFHPDSLYYSVIYGDTSQPVPGYFTGYGTSQLTFTFDSSAITNPPDTNLQYYYINATQINVSSKTLTHIPSKPGLVKNTSTVSGPDFYYQGVFDSEIAGRVIESWPSDSATGYNNFALVYPGSDTATTRTETMASTVEVHYFVKTDSSNVSTTSSTSDTLTINSIIAPADASSAYNILAISKLNNVTAGFSYKIKDIVLPTGLGGMINIQTAPGFPFVGSTVFEVIGQCLADPNFSTRNGASTNFMESEKKIGTFCESVILSNTTSIQTPVTLSLSNNDLILGVGSTDFTNSGNTILPFCWIDPTGLSQYAGVRPIEILSDFTSNFVTFNVINPPSNSATVTLQALTKQNTLVYPSGTTTDGLLIGYDYIPYQSISELPATLTMQVALKPTVIYVSNLGTGGSSFDREPYQQPLINIPVNDPLILDDNSFYNVEPLKFANFSIDGGFVQLPAYVPGNLGGVLNLSNPQKDNQQRFFFGTCAKDFVFRTEGLLIPAPRKIFTGLLGRVLSSSDSKLLRGEYILMIVSRNDFLSLENSTGFSANNKSVIAIYRLPNRPIVRI
jgi:hypothetical protein